MTILTNAHTHLELGWLAEHCPAVSGAPFAPWVAGLVEHCWELSGAWEGVCEAAVEDGILELLSAGTTHVGDVTHSGKSIAPLLASGLRGVVYVEALGLRVEKAEDYLNRARAIVEQWRPRERNGMKIGLSIHAPYSVHPALWQKALDYARKEALPLCIHIAESQVEYAYLTLDTGPLVDEYFVRLNLPTFKPPMTTPVRYLEDMGALALKPLLVHGVQVTEDDIMRIAGNECCVVHCPRANLRLECGRMPLDAYLVAGVKVYLGTESRAASPSLNVRDELEVAVALHHGRVPPEAIAALAHQPLPDEEADRDE